LEGRVLRKWKKQVEGIEELEKFIFLHNIKTTFGETQKLYWKGIL
jgi:hypothetical protein